MAEIVLRPYQEKFIADIRDQFKHGFKRVVGVAPCGAGKTIMTGWMIRESLQRGFSSIFFVHRRELIEQTSDTFNQLHIPHGIICGGFKPNYNLPVQIASVQTLVNRLPLINQPSFLICDECHHILADSYKRIINAWNDSFLLGVTATPLRHGGITLSDVFSAMVQAPSVPELIQLGNLTNFDYFEMNIDLAANVSLEDSLSNVKISKGDYDIKGLSKVMDDPLVTQGIVDSYFEHALNKSAICYCVNIDHSQTLTDAFNAAGISAAHCDGSTPKDERAQIVNDFRLGKYKILCNAELFGEGFDVPNCHAVILARPTKSLTLYIQQSMRSMRPDPSDPNKVAIIIDCVKNCKRHGYPDTPRNWSLDINKADNEGVAPTKFCPFCHFEIPLASDFCPVCGKQLVFPDTVISVDSAEQIYSSNDNTTEIDTPSIIYAPTFEDKFWNFVGKGKLYSKIKKPERWAAYQMLNSVTSFDQLVTLRKLSDMAYGWEFHQAQKLNIPIPQKKGLQKSPSTVTI